MSAIHPAIAPVPPPPLPDIPSEADRKAKAAQRHEELELLEEIKGERDPFIERYGYNNSCQRASSWWRSR